MGGISVLLLILGFLFAILSIILFFKLWNMCDNVDVIMQKLTETKSDSYHWSTNCSMKAFDKEIEYVKECIFCGKTEEAYCILKRLQYHLMMEGQNSDYVEEDQRKYMLQCETVQEMLNNLPSVDR